MNVSNCLWKYQGRQQIFMCLAVILCEQFCRFANGGAKISIKSVLLHEILFLSQCIQQQWSIRQNYFHSERVNCRLQLAGLGKKREETVKPTWFSLLYAESGFGTTDTTDKSFTVFFTNWGVKFDRRLRISARWVRKFDHWVTYAVEAKEKLAMILFCGFWFSDMTFHVMLRWRLKFR